MKDNNISTRLKTLEKLIKAGFNTDEKIRKLTLDDVWQIKDLMPVDLLNIKGLIKAVKEKNLIAFFSGLDLRKEEK